MNDPFRKNSSCEYCGTDLDAKYRNKRFCSSKCRVYFNRENKVMEMVIKETISEPLITEPKELSVEEFNQLGWKEKIEYRNQLKKKIK